MPAFAGRDMVVVLRAERDACGGRKREGLVSRAGFALQASDITEESDGICGSG